ncbi:hypothetical protein LCGC14_1723400, partial [marine sediment metagenome]
MASVDADVTLRALMVHRSTGAVMDSLVARENGWDSNMARQLVSAYAVGMQQWEGSVPSAGVNFPEYMDRSGVDIINAVSRLCSGAFTTVIQNRVANSLDEELIHHG